MTQLMMCGHAANAVDDNGKPLCGICAGINDGADVVAANADEYLTHDREAACCYCGKRRPSSLDLPFFRAQPDKDVDEYYCGCWGWD